MNPYFMLFVIFGVISSLHASAQEKSGNLPSELCPISYLFYKIFALEGQLKKLEEKDDEMKKMIEERDDKVNLLDGQVKNLSAQLENFQGHSAIEPAFIVTATKSNGHIPGRSVITFDDKVIDHSNSFIIEEGKFIVPSSGNYLFFFNSDAVNTGHSNVEVYLNGNLNYYFWETNGDSDHHGHQHNFMFTSKLEEDDELWLYNVLSDTLYNNDFNPMTFVGYKTN